MNKMTIALSFMAFTAMAQANTNIRFSDKDMNFVIRMIKNTRVDLVAYDENCLPEVIEAYIMIMKQGNGDNQGIQFYPDLPQSSNVGRPVGMGIQNLCNKWIKNSPDGDEEKKEDLCAKLIKTMNEVGYKWTAQQIWEAKKSI